MRTFLFAIMLMFISMSSILNVSAKTYPVVINEVQITGGSGHSNDDFIELFNNSASPVDLTGWKLKKKIKTGTESTIYNFSVASDEKIIIPSNGYFLWANKDGAPAEKTLPAFANDAILSDNYSLALFDTDDNLVDAITYGSGHASIFTPSLIFASNPAAKTSLERDLENNVFILQNTPSPANNTSIEKETLKEDPDQDEEISSTDLTIRINEIFPNPKEKGEAGEYIELFNFGAKDLDLDGFVLRDASATGKYVFPKVSLIASGGYFLIEKETSKLSLNNSEESVSLFDDKENLIDSISYDKTKDGASFGFDGSAFRWSRYLTPAEANQFDDLPESKTSIPKLAYKKIPVTFSAKGSSSHKFTWDFGDDAKSYRQTAIHTYKKNGSFKGSLTIDNGFEETKKYFTVKVKKFSSKDISIVEIAANPQGADSDNEYLLLKNSGKKKIDLSGWSIASGTQKDKLTNHPIRETFILKKGSQKKLTSAFSSFSLPNQSGIVELRQPDGSIVQKISYQKNGSIAENEVYSLQADKEWNWAKSVSGSSEKTDIDVTEELVKNEDNDQDKYIRLENLSPDERARLESEVEQKLREKILAEVRLELGHYENQISQDKDEPSVVLPLSESDPQTEDTIQETSFFDKLRLQNLISLAFSEN